MIFTTEKDSATNIIHWQFRITNFSRTINLFETFSLLSFIAKTGKSVADNQNIVFFSLDSTTELCSLDEVVH